MDAEKHSNSRWSGWNYFGGTAANENINITGATTGISLEGGNNILYIIKQIGNNAGNGKGIDIVDGTTINIGGTVAGQANLINQNTAAGIVVEVAPSYDCRKLYWCWRSRRSKGKFRRY